MKTFFEYIRLEQWFSTFFVPQPIIATHYNPTNPI